MLCQEKYDVHVENNGDRTVWTEITVRFLTNSAKQGVEIVHSFSALEKKYNDFTRSW